ncbi:RNA dependent RNA polymerase-domain-containing protein [Zychaea mexicana]|uniref:RNA dependent RNA polymerase-domain-containing protein n=1 Tax=Zychaea mexicana TaxID=64656 RepID=UPI0022FEC69D|nr:RNA dependent RNA polymerase-domain-containing protein [Zychaea mexicana]KAI9488695.1 RNA dependent RNA polymerase-domain-containing protein [Zychaea mexicana]
MLEINHTANYSCAHLNRQLISILSSLKVPDSVFLDILDDMVHDVDKMLTDPLQASRILRETADGLGIQHAMAKIVEAGFLQRRDPYIKNLLEAFRVARLKEARKKARIPVIKGVFLMGVLDETNTLQENQIFCKFIDGDYNEQTLTGECLVYRSPSLHPGDVRMLKAVDIPQLRDLCNVVVFPAQGERDIPSMCSGGDLDGDCYSVIWDKRLFPPPDYRNIIPMSYTAPKPLTLADEVTIDHIKEFFVSFIKLSNLGQIANAHLAKADRSPDGVFDFGCIQLAEYHSMAVDFAKTGVPAEPNPSLLTMPNQRYPDFMEKKDKPSYESEKALGKLFRRIGHIKYREYRDTLWDVNTDGVYYDARIQVPGMESYIGEARRLKRYYDRELRDMMGRFGVNSEAEIMSGWIIKWMHKRRNERLFEVQQQARKDMMRMKTRWYHTEFSASKNIAMKQEDLEAKAAAWYYVAYHPHEQRRQREEGKQFDKRYNTHDEELLSFPWVAQSILCELARKRMGISNTNSAYPTFAEDVIAMYDPGEPPSDQEDDDYSESDYGSEYEP